MNENPWARLLAYVTGLINQELILKNEYLAAENRILRAHQPARLRLSNPERSTLAEIGKRLGRKALAQVACFADSSFWTLQARKQRFRSSTATDSNRMSIPIAGASGPMFLRAGEP
jgi:hypothetical protein